MEYRKSKKIIIISSVVIALTAGLSLYNHGKQNEINSDVQARNTVLEKKQKELSNLPETVTNNMLKDNDTENGKELKASNETIDRSTAFFNELYDIDSRNSDKSWANRLNNLKQFATEDAIKATGMNYNSQGLNRAYDLIIKVKNVKVNTTLTHKDEIGAIAEVTYDQTSNLQEKATENTVVYMYFYNLKTKKIFLLRPLGQLNSKDIKQN